ncbi:MAG: ketoacyl-ACP synthase III [Candidatus Firestonebacteria bacterium]|nr:ketoacyl-ACP synthase III [Candidatus Firestonebacteria bacterium]
MTAGVVGTGMYVPEKVLTNADLEKMVDTNDEWITSRVGIKERRIAAPGETTSSMGAAAARAALADAGITAAEVDLIITATITPDMPWPSTACFIQRALGATRAACFDVEAACTGFVYALSLARNYVATGMYRTVLVVAAETLSRITDWEDRNTAVLFGDAAGAAVIKAVAPPAGILATHLGADGSKGELLEMPGGGSRHPTSHETVEARMHFIRMKGNEVFKHAARAMAHSNSEVLAKAGITIDQVDLLIPHQANMRIIEAAARLSKLPMEKVYLNLMHYGNTSAATTAVALAEARRDKRVGPGSLCLLVAFGGGFTWGACLLRL